MKTSIIMNAYDNDIVQRQITIAALGNIQKYTDDYELILVDNGKFQEINDKYNCIELTKHIQNKEDIGFSASMNLGARESNSEYPYICFIHNDVFVWEWWLPKLLKKLDKIDVIFPSQGHITREQVLASYRNELDRLDNDAGLMVMSKENYKKSGGWDERFCSVFQEKAYRDKMIRNGLSINHTPDVIITHIGWITVGFDDSVFENNRSKEGEILSKIE